MTSLIFNFHGTTRASAFVMAGWRELIAVQFHQHKKTLFVASVLVADVQNEMWHK